MEAMTLCRGRYPLLWRSKLIPPQRPAILKCPYLTGRSREWLRGYFSIHSAKPDADSSSHRRQAKRNWREQRSASTNG